MSHFLSITIVVAAAIWALFLVSALCGKFIISIMPLFRNNKKRISKNGIVADAIILKMEKTGLYINQQPQFILQMQVQPDKGRNFIAEIKQLQGTNLEKLRAGSTVKVKYNPQNFRELILL